MREREGERGRQAVCSGRGRECRVGTADRSGRSALLHFSY